MLAMRMSSWFVRAVAAGALLPLLLAQGPPAGQPGGQPVTQPGAQPGGQPGDKPAGQGPAPGGTAAPASELPPIGDPAAVPDGAPPHLALVARGRLREHAYWLADDARQGRFTSSAAQQATAKYVADHFQRLGLKPLGDKKGFLQSYPIEQLALDPSTALSFGDVKITDVGVLPAGDAKVSLAGRFAWCGKGRGDEIPGALKGRIPVVVLDKLPRGNGPAGDLGAIQRYFELARQLAKSEAAAGVVALVGDPGPLANTLNYRGVLPDHPQVAVAGSPLPTPASIPLLVIAGEHSKALLAHLGATIDAQGAVVPPPDDSKAVGKLQIALKRNPKGFATNVVAVLEGGSRKAEAIVFSAHHDHIGRRIDGDTFNGADDNASGTAGLLTIAEAFAKGGERPDRSIVFLSVSGEELGLWGSRWFSEHPTWPLDKIVADVNIDMIGRAEQDGDNTKIQITPSREHAKYSTIGRTAAKLAPRLKITFTSGDQYYERSDHFNFAQKGVPVVFLCDGEHPDYHQVTDSADKLAYDRMEAVARLAFWTGWEVAESKERPKELGAQPDW